ncbi:hypothetical protein PCASD_26212 [Puccinia coronata f. sp. avenae]|uniref:Uncharacterized protein n=1 Tax=Puccinia coronata f. sp. avenae TaxID=200324 RepID=A0A2N5SCU5_9BASI|nr:hypothetical protein PCASD_26229 [Puccinia coronata f. sp. avenae]PLW26908.1 hypothetical protein PCASD_26212 [Puccinia coronata f. sp. avenae]
MTRLAHRAGHGLLGKQVLALLTKQVTPHLVSSSQSAHQAGHSLLGEQATNYSLSRASTAYSVSGPHCQQCWLGWLHPSLHWMQPSNSNLGAGPPSESRTDSNSVAKRQGHRV